MYSNAPSPLPYTSRQLSLRLGTPYLFPIITFTKVLFFLIVTFFNGKVNYILFKLRKRSIMRCQSLLDTLPDFHRLKGWLKHKAFIRNQATACFPHGT